MKQNQSLLLKVSLHHHGVKVCRSGAGDQHLIDEAPAYALHRLRKAELVRLWKVAGMWQGQEDADGVEEVEEDDHGMSKRELVDGIIAAVSFPQIALRLQLTSQRKATPASRASSSGPSSQESTSAESPLQTRHSASPLPHGDGPDVDATPRAIPRTRSIAKVRMDGSATKPTKRRPIKGVRERLLKARSKSMGGPGDREKDDRKARFGDDVKSPAHGLLTYVECF